jgi:hypothetical protein
VRLSHDIEPLGEFTRQTNLIVALGTGYIARFNLQVIVGPAVHCRSDLPIGADRTRAAVVVEDIARIPVNDIAGSEVYVSTVIGNVGEVSICFENEAVVRERNSRVCSIAGDIAAVRWGGGPINPGSAIVQAAAPVVKVSVL